MRERGRGRERERERGRERDRVCERERDRERERESVCVCVRFSSIIIFSSGFYILSYFHIFSNGIHIFTHNFLRAHIFDLSEGQVITEVLLDEKVTGYRAQLSQGMFLEPSFPTIAGVNGNGAIVHYRYREWYYLFIH